ncbi:TniQ family protein [Rhizobacter fulvus]
MKTWGPSAPHVDELAISVVARYARDWGYLDGASVVTAGLGLTQLLSHPAAPGPLQTLAAIAFPEYADHIARMAFIRRHTTLPYFLAFEPRALAKAVLCDLVSGKQRTVYRAYRPAMTLCGQPERLRFCPRCLRLDARRLGGGIWHRSHQLPALTHCPRHGTPLLDSDVPYTGSPWSELRAPSAHICRELAENITKPLFGEALTQSVAAASIRLLGRSPGSAHVSVDAYRRALRVLGLGKFSRRVQTRAVVDDFSKWLRINGGEVSSLGPARWPESLFTQIESPTSPLQHLVFRCYLSDRLRVVSFHAGVDPEAE